MKISAYFKAKKQAKQAFQIEWQKYLEEIKKKETLIRHNTDFAMLEEYIQQCNNNPGLVINVTLADGTKLEIKTVKDERKVNPLFTDQVFQE